MEYPGMNIPVMMFARDDSSSTNSSGVYHPYPYVPSLAAAAIFIILFLITLIIHIGLAVKYRLAFTAAFIVGIAFEVAGYVGRALGHHNDVALGPFILQSLTILVAPALFSASLYMTLGRVIRLINGEGLAMVKSKNLTKMFVAGDFFAFFAQTGGAGLQASKNTSTQHTARYIIIGGLTLQCLWFGFFVVIALRFHKAAKASRQVRQDLPWAKHLHILYICSGLIFFRSVFRIIEYIQGDNGYLISHEVFLYLFDTLLMFIVVLVWIWRHPGQLLGPHNQNMRPADYEANVRLDQTQKQYLVGGNTAYRSAPSRDTSPHY